MHELLFVGAGPHALTTLARLLEPDADATIDQPFRRAVAKAKVLRYWGRQRSSVAYRTALKAWLRQHVLVVDPAGDWMVRWRQQFDALGISHLRSTTAVHPDPLDTYALATHAATVAASGQGASLRELVLPLKQLAKSRFYAGPFAAPSADMFDAFCADLVRRYALDGLVTRDAVVGLTPVFADSSGSLSSLGVAAKPGAAGQRRDVQFWRVQLASGRELAARHVVMAIGSTNVPRVPQALQHLIRPAGSQRAPEEQEEEEEAACGSSVLSLDTPQPATSCCLPPPSDALPWDLGDSSPSEAASLAASDSVCCSTEGCDGGCSNASSGWGSDASLPLPARCADGDDDDDDAGSTHSSSSSLPSSPVSHWLAGGQADSGPDDGGSGSYPHGRLMHAWQLVEAVSGRSSCQASGGDGCQGKQRGTASDSSSSGISSRTAAAAQRLLAAGLLRPGEHVLIIGGGLTAAHLASLAAAAGCTASLALRGPSLRVKQFDVDTPWMGRHRRDVLLKSFHQAARSSAERARLLRRALQGGSVPPEAAETLAALARGGALQLLEGAGEVAAAEWAEDASGGSTGGSWQVWMGGGGDLMVEADRVWLATGSVVNAAQDPLLSQLLQQLPVPLAAGLPAIQPDLQWAPGTKLWVLGAYAALQLGPGAANLAGAKTGSVVLEPQLRRALPPLPAAVLGAGLQHG